jgi:methionyl-tRNA formyltransferase
MKIVFMGTPDFAVGTLQAIVEAGHEVAAVVTQPDKRKGRGKEISMTPVKEKALEYFTKAHEIKPSQVDTLYYLATLAIERGDREKAREYLEKTLTGNYSSLCTTTREQAQSLLDTLA